MQPQVIIQINETAEFDREVIDRLVGENMKKIDSYLLKLINDPTAEIRIEVTVNKNHDSSFYGKLHASIDGKLIIYEREKFRKLDDLINHAFEHLKVQLGGEKVKKLDSRKKKIRIDE